MQLAPELFPWWSLLGGILITLVVVKLVQWWLDATRLRNQRAPTPVVPRERVTSVVSSAPERTSGLSAANGAVAQDPLTGLATRLTLEDHLAQSALRAEGRHQRLALLYIDLDGFKPVNDSFGHSLGDAVLKEVAKRLRLICRSADTVARLGADEFLVLMDGDPDASAATLLADKLRRTLERTYTLDGREVRLSCSVGVVLFPEHGPRARLIARADAAMMAAKRAGGGMHCLYDAHMDQDTESAVELQRALRTALEQKRGLLLYYQPKIDSASGQISGVEALVRWEHPTMGLISPGQFIPVAERFGLIGALGLWVLDEAARQLKVWRGLGLNMRVAINLSVHQLRLPDLPARVRDVLARHQVPADLITFELTESAAMEDPEATLRIFENLASSGVGLSIDDFGTGYSSLSYLRKLPACQIKIDRSFVQDVCSQSDARAIIKAVIKLSHALGLEVVAEGVETVEQQDMLKQLGCDQLQGFLYAKPMPAEHLQLWAMSDDLPAHVPTFRDSLFNADEIDR